MVELAWLDPEIKVWGGDSNDLHCIWWKWKCGGKWADEDELTPAVDSQHCRKNYEYIAYEYLHCRGQKGRAYCLPPLCLCLWWRTVLLLRAQNKATKWCTCPAVQMEWDWRLWIFGDKWQISHKNANPQVQRVRNFCRPSWVILSIISSFLIWLVWTALRQIILTESGWSCEYLAFFE
jgi:hypothetical protein